MGTSLRILVGVVLTVFDLAVAFSVAGQSRSLFFFQTPARHQLRSQKLRCYPQSSTRELPQEKNEALIGLISSKSLFFS
jgi:hypothetical protein